jgi:hypothetical protein
MSTGILADAVSVRHALLFVPVLAVIGVVANAPSRRRQVAPA